MAKQPNTRVIAVFSSFRPNETLLEHVQSAMTQVREVVVVDDGSDEQCTPLLTSIERAGAKVIRQPANLGIAAAMNKGFDVAKELSAEFVVAFDQDSQVPEGFIDALVNEYDRATERGLNVAMVAPEWYSETRQTHDQTVGGVLISYAPIQSGLLMPMKVIEELGTQREDFFIDLVETEYYFRARTKGYEAVCAPGLKLPHGFGHRLYVHFFGKRMHKRNGKPRMVALSSPFRYYYRARNRVALNRLYRDNPELHRLLRRDGLRDFVLDFMVAVWSARGKAKLISLMWVGWRDARKHRMGRMPERLALRARNITWRHPVD